MKKIMKNTLCLGLFCLASQVYAAEPIPEESGFSGFIQLGVGATELESNMVAGDLGSRTTSSLQQSPGSESKVAGLFNGELKYTFASTGTQIFLGNSLEDLVRYDFTSQLGARQEIGKAGIIGGSVLFTTMPTEVWKDPYMTNTRRQSTDRTSQGARVMWENIMGSKLDVRYSYRQIELDSENSGAALGLTSYQQALLDREGDQYNLTGEYTFVLDDKNTLTPSLSIIVQDLDGEAMANDEVGLKLTHTYMGERFVFITNVGIATAEYDQRNPVFNKSQEDDSFGFGFIAMYKNLMDVKGLTLVGNIAFYDVDSNIAFYDSSIVTSSVSCLYRF